MKPANYTLLPQTAQHWERRPQRRRTGAVGSGGGSPWQPRPERLRGEAGQLPAQAVRAARRKEERRWTTPAGRLSSPSVPRSAAAHSAPRSWPPRRRRRHRRLRPAPRVSAGPGCHAPPSSKEQRGRRGRTAPPPARREGDGGWRARAPRAGGEARTARATAATSRLLTARPPSAVPIGYCPVPSGRRTPGRRRARASWAASRARALLCRRSRATAGKGEGTEGTAGQNGAVLLPSLPPNYRHRPCQATPPLLSPSRRPP